jgi:hypothetical protein
MNPGFGNILEGLNGQQGIKAHGSVEDLIRNVLGNSFMQAAPQQVLPVADPVMDEPIDIPKLEDKPIPPPKKKEEPRCGDCDQPISGCICQFDEVEFDDDHSEDEEDLSPFQRVLRSGQYKETKSETSPYKKSDGIGLPPKEKVPVKPISKHYTFYRDKDEVFECKVTIEGTMSTATARLILVTDTWNLVFYGKIKKDGTCLIPIKKLSVFPIGTTGRATLEVVVDDVVFSAWEDAFRVEESRRVKVQIKGKS